MSIEAAYFIMLFALFLASVSNFSLKGLLLSDLQREEQLFFLPTIVLPSILDPDQGALSGSRLWYIVRIRIQNFSNHLENSQSSKDSVCNRIQIHLHISFGFLLLSLLQTRGNLSVEFRTKAMSNQCCGIGYAGVYIMQNTLVAVREGKIEKWKEEKIAIKMGLSALKVHLSISNISELE